MLKEVKQEIVKEIFRECFVCIDEESYQKIKRQLEKKDDYFNIEELIEFTKIYMKIDVILT